MSFSLPDAEEMQDMVDEWRDQNVEALKAIVSAIITSSHDLWAINKAREALAILVRM